MVKDIMLIKSSKILLFAHFLLFIQPDSGLSQSLPQFSLHPSNIITTKGSTVTLSCILDTTENVTYKWAVNGSILISPTGSYSVGQGGQSLTISSITFNMEGNYSCLVSNGNWTLTSKYATVRLQYLSSNSDGEFTIITVKENDYVVIDCIPDYESYPEPVISDFSWIIAGSLTVNDFDNSLNNVDMGSNGNLYLRRVVQTEVYTCRLLFGSKSIEYTTTVNISGLTDPPPGPVIITQPQSVIVNTGDRVIMNCIAAGTPDPTISWSKPSGSNAIVSNSRKFELRIDNVGPNDVGNYSCNATGVGSSSIASVNIRAPPSLTTLPPPSSINVTWGETFTLNCSANGSDLVWAWFHNGIWISSGSSITIENTDLSATGAYQCFVSNLAGNVGTATFVQVQTIPPTFTPNGSLSDQLAFSGRQHTLVCKAIGAPMPTYQWKKDGTLLGPGNIDFDISTPGQLILKSVSALLQGSYTCVAKSTIDQIMIGESNTTAHLTVVDPTSITSSHLPSVSIFVGESFTLNCSAGHDTKRTTIDIKWMHNGEVINSTSHTVLKSNGQTDLSLTVNNATTRDQGQYQCIIHTTLINNSHLITPIINSIITYVNITTAPVKPVITELRTLTSNIIEVNWKYNGFPGNLNSFKIDTQVGPVVNPNSWVTQITVPGSSSTRKNITNLRPYTHYWVRVVAVLKNGQQVDSLTYESSRTKEDVPSAAPSNVNAITRSKTSLSLHWEAVEESSRNGILIDYTVRYWTNSSRGGVITYYNVSVGSNTTSYGLTSLQADTTYYIAIAAHTRPGIGPFSAPIKGTTDPTIGGTDNQSSSPVYERVWFIFTLSVIGLAILVVVVGMIAAIRWSKKRKGHKYPVRNSFIGEDGGSSFSADVVAYYENRKKVEPIETMYTDGGESESSQATFQPSFSHATYASSNDGSIRLGIPVPPSYINPPSFEDTLKARMNRRRSASMSFLEKAEHLQLNGSGWSIGHDPKSAFHSTGFMRDDNTDSGSIDKARLQGPDDEISGNSNDSGLHSRDFSSKSGTLSSFV